MDFGFSEEQEMIKKMVRDFGETECPKSLVRQMEQDEKGFSADTWKKMAELGWMGLPFPEKYGGSGASFLDLMVLIEEIGRACVPAPFFSTVMLGGMTLLIGGSEEQKQELLPGISMGEIIVTLALNEVDAKYEPSAIKTEAVSEGQGFRINGTKLFVPDAHVARWIICAAKSSEGITLFLIDSKSKGVEITPLKTLAGNKECEVVLHDVQIPAKNVVGRPGKGWEIVEAVLTRAKVAKCVEIVGMAQKSLEMTVEHAKQRIQFGHPIGSLQIIQTYCANMMTDVETTKLITYEAAWMLSQGRPCAREVMIAKGWASSASRRVAALSQQVHGAMGFTAEYDLGLYYRRLKAAELVFGDEEAHKELIAKEMGY
jgi:alkylation response protein AidB-like acyl-CoA dehydrogenase